MQAMQGPDIAALISRSASAACCSAVLRWSHVEVSVAEKSFSHRGTSRELGGGDERRSITEQASGRAKRHFFEWPARSVNGALNSGAARRRDGDLRSWHGSALEHDRWIDLRSDVICRSC